MPSAPGPAIENYRRIAGVMKPSAHRRDDGSYRTDCSRKDGIPPSNYEGGAPEKAGRPAGTRRYEGTGQPQVSRRRTELAGRPELQDRRSPNARKPTGSAKKSRSLVGC